MKSLLVLLLSAALLPSVATSQCSLIVNTGPNCRLVYAGYDPLACTDITASVSGGDAPYSYVWSTGETTQTITVCPEEVTVYGVTVTDADGCSQDKNNITVQTIAVACGNGGKKVIVCHIPPGNPPNWHEICVSPNAVPAHLAHGCLLGGCLVLDPCTEGEPRGLTVAQQNFRPQAEFDTPQLWPNPGSNELNIDLPSHVSGIVSVKLQSLNGQTLRTLAIPEGQKSASLSDLQSIAAGLYYVRIVDVDGNDWMLKWMKVE